MCSDNNYEPRDFVATSNTGDKISLVASDFGSIPKEAVDNTKLLAETIDLSSPHGKLILDVAPNMPILGTNRLQLWQVFANLSW